MSFKLLPTLRFITALSILVSVSPAWGGTVYVPLAVDLEIEGVRILTEVRVTNDADVENEIQYLYLPANGDGTVPDRESRGSRLTLQPHQSLVLDNLVGPVSLGVLEITMPDHVSVTSRLVGRPLDGEARAGAEMPVVTSENLHPAGEEVLLQGWRRTGSRIATDFFVFNLDEDPALCTIAVFRRGGILVEEQTLPVPPLGLLPVIDAIGQLGLVRPDEMRSRVSCDRPFYPFAVIRDFHTAEMVYVPPSGSGRSELVAPGSEPPPPVGPPPPDVPCPEGALFEKVGSFHRPRVGAETRRFALNLPAGQRFSKFTVDVDVTLGDWNPQDSDGNHAILWLHRGDLWRGNLFGYVNIFGPPRIRAKISTNADLPRGEIRPFERLATFENGVKYHVHYVYDTASRLMEAVFTENTGKADEREVVRVTGQTSTDAIRSQDGQFFLWFGHPTGTAGPEVPTYGWLYSNLCVQVE